MNNTVFNLNNVNKPTKTLFLPEEQGLSIQRYDDPLYPHILKMLNIGFGLYWLPEEIKMDTDKINFPKLSESEKHIVISNIKSQILLDSIMGRAPYMVFGPAINDPVFETLVCQWTYQEAIHSKSYTYIIQNSFDDPEGVLSTVMDAADIVERSNTITEYYDDCIDKVAKYYNGECSKREACEAIWLAIHGANALESIRFPVSFACSFAFAEMGLLPGLGNVISLINRDESFHVAITNFLLKALPDDDPIFKEISEDKEIIGKIRALWKKTYDEENKWADYLFVNGDAIGLNKNVVKKYLTYVATARLEATKVGSTQEVLGVDPVTENPIAWVNKWLSNKDNQPAPQESELTNYEKGVIDMSSGLGSLKFRG